MEGTEELTLDNMTDIAIESEAEEVQEVTEDDQTLYQVMCVYNVFNTIRDDQTLCRLCIQMTCVYYFQNSCAVC